MPIQCDIVTQERTVFSGEVDSVNLPGSEGRMGILPNHTALLTTLDFGEVIVRQGNQEEYFAIGGGFVEVQPDHVTILADSAEHAEEIDQDRAARARERAEKLMTEGVPEDPEYYAQVRASLMRAQVRMDVARRRRRRTMPTGRKSTVEDRS
jgi:F-type H+-transporting ATPase subunit epsilon